MEPEWLRDPAVVGNIASLAKNREVKWTWKLPDGKQIGIRQTRIAWSRDFERWITMLGIDQRHLDIFISTNQLDWKALPELPPPHLQCNREKGQKRFKRFTNPSKCSFISRRTKIYFDIRPPHGSFSRGELKLCDSGEKVELLQQTWYLGLLQQSLYFPMEIRWFMV